MAIKLSKTFTGYKLNSGKCIPQESSTFALHHKSSSQSALSCILNSKEGCKSQLTKYRGELITRVTCTNCHFVDKN